MLSDRMAKQNIKIEKKEERKEMRVGGISTKTMGITLVGTSPLITHKFSTRQKETMLAKQMKKADRPVGRSAKDPEQDYQDSIYFLKDGRYGFPVSAFKNAAVDACTFMDKLPKTLARGAFHIIDESGEGLLPIEGSKPYKREDIVRLGGMGSPADIRYRGCYPIGWKVRLLITYNENAISPEQIAQLFNTAGFGVGIGDWRPQNNGSCGMFKVDGKGNE